MRLDNLIKEYRNRGLSDNEIENQLREKGYSKSAIREGFHDASTSYKADGSSVSEGTIAATIGAFLLITFISGAWYVVKSDTLFGPPGILSNEPKLVADRECGDNTTCLASSLSTCRANNISADTTVKTPQNLLSTNIVFSANLTNETCVLNTEIAGVSLEETSQPINTSDRQRRDLRRELSLLGETGETGQCRVPFVNGSTQFEDIGGSDELFSDPCIRTTGIARQADQVIDVTLSRR